jgi:hypothetical protein
MPSGGSLRTAGKPAIEVFEQFILESTAVHYCSFSFVPVAPKRFSSVGNNRCMWAMA